VDSPAQGPVDEVTERLQSFRREDRGASLRFDVTDAGPPDGQPVVLLHGFPQDRTCWEGLAPLLHAAGYRTLAPDQRGYSPGARPRGRLAYRRPELVGDVVTLLDAAGLESAHVVGHDWGAVVGWALTSDHPERVRTLTALSVPHPVAYVQAMRTGRQARRSAYIAFFQLPVAPEGMLLADGATRLHQLLVRSGLPPAEAGRYVERMREPGALSAALAWYRALPWSLPPRVGRIGVPTLYAWGSRDIAIDREGAERTGDLVDGPYRLEILEGAGHWLPETAADRLAPVVLETLGRG
jgi:pimeloyl-ACP methyl ester carboxylesterase